MPRQSHTTELIFNYLQLLEGSLLSKTGGLRRSPYEILYRIPLPNLVNHPAYGNAGELPLGGAAC